MSPPLCLSLSASSYVRSSVVRTLVAATGSADCSTLSPRKHLQHVVVEAQLENADGNRSCPFAGRCAEQASDELYPFSLKTCAARCASTAACLFITYEVHASRCLLH